MTGNRDPLYSTWKGMRQRCNDPHSKSWKDYGGRGIRICARWDDFAAFLADMGPKPSPRHSIDRINNDGHYEPDNCRWATREAQRKTRRQPVHVRRSHCVRGHPFDETNTYWHAGQRFCRRCNAMSKRVTT